MPSNIDYELEAFLEARFTAGELAEELGITIADIVEAFPRLCNELMKDMQ